MTARKITYNGKTQSVTAWEKETGLSDATIRDRLKLGWDTERALTTPPDQIANRKQGAARELKDGIVSSYLSVWNKLGKEEFEKQLADAFANDALKTVRDFAQYLPKEVLERAEKSEERAVVRIEIHGEIQPPKITLGDK